MEKGTPLPYFYSGFDTVQGKSNKMRRSFTALVKDFLKTKNLFHCNMVQTMQCIVANVGSITDVQKYRFVDFQNLSTWTYTRNLTDEIHAIRKYRYDQVLLQKQTLGTQQKQLTHKQMSEIIQDSKNRHKIISGQFALLAQRKQATFHKKQLIKDARAFLIPMPDQNCLLNAAFNCLAPVDRTINNLRALQQLIPTNPTMFDLQRVSQFFQLAIFDEDKITQDQFALQLQRYNLYLPIIVVITIRDRELKTGKVLNITSHACVYLSQYHTHYQNFAVAAQLLTNGWAFAQKYNHYEKVYKQTIYTSKQVAWPFHPEKQTTYYGTTSRIRYVYPRVAFYAVSRFENIHQHMYVSYGEVDTRINGDNVQKVVRSRLGIEQANIVFRSYQIEDYQWYAEFGDIDYLVLYDQREEYARLLDQHYKLGEADFKFLYADQMSEDSLQLDTPQFNQENDEVPSFDSDLFTPYMIDESSIEQDDVIPLSDLLYVTYSAEEQQEGLDDYMQKLVLVRKNAIPPDDLQDDQQRRSCCPGVE